MRKEMLGALERIKQRNLIYTAMTRGRRLVCIVGAKKALWQAVRNATRRERNTALAAFLRVDPAKPSPPTK